MQEIQGFVFEIGHPLYGSSFNDIEGLYIIYAANGTVLDVGETNKLGRRLSSHERRIFWLLNAGGQPIYVAFHKEANGFQRLLKERILRMFLNPLCGER